MSLRHCPWCKPKAIEAPCVIDRLPDTLLYFIFELDHDNNQCPSESGWRPDHEKSTVTSVSRVCKRWNAIAASLMYRNIRTDLGKIKGRRSCRRLHRNLLSGAALPTWTKEVDILIDGIHSADFEKEDVVTLVHILRLWQLSLRRAGVHGNLGLIECRPVLFQLAKMPLEELSISGYEGGISLSFFLKYFQYPGLKKLRLHRMTWNHDKDLSAGQRHDKKRVLYIIEDLHLPRERQYTARLKDLHINDPAVPALTLRTLFKWPRALESVKFSYLMHSQWADRYHARAIQQLLDLQAHAIRSIELGSIHQLEHSVDIPSFIDMPELSSLRLNMTDVLPQPGSSVCLKLLAPKLQTFIIDFDTEDQHGTSPSEVNEKTIEWLIDFARTWSSWKHREVASALRIHFDFSPDTGCGLWDPEKVQWPWRHLETAKSKVEQYGVEVTWTEPRWNAQQWYEEIKASWDEHRDI